MEGFPKLGLAAAAVVVAAAAAAPAGEGVPGMAAPMLDEDAAGAALGWMESDRQTDGEVAERCGIRWRGFLGYLCEHAYYEPLLL